MDGERKGGEGKEREWEGDVKAKREEGGNGREM